MLQEIKVPQVAESIRQVTIAQWLKPDGSFVESDEIICTFETEKATLDLVAEHSGKLTFLVAEGSVVEVGSVIGSVDTAALKPANTSAHESQTPAPAKIQPKIISEARALPKNHSAAGTLSPAAAILLEKSALQSSNLHGSGKDGRITHQDVQKALLAKAAEIPSPQDLPTPINSPSPAPQTGVRREKMSTLRRKLAQRLVSMKNQTALTTTFNEVDMTEVQALRTRHKQAFQDKHGVRLGLMPFFMKAASQALREFPVLNASVDNDEILYHERHDFSIAVNTPRGLLVPVVRSVEKLTYAEIEKTIADLAVRGREGKLNLDEMSGGTFSITNGGVFGSMLSTPLINPPQSAILGMHNIVERPVAWQGQVVIRPIMYLALSYDHRIIDGRDSVSFLLSIKKMLEDPGQLLLGI